MIDPNRPPGISDQEWKEILEIYSVISGRISERELSQTRDPDLDEQFGSVSLPSESLHVQMERVLSQLSETERKAVELSFGLNDGRSRTHFQVAQELGLPEEEVEPLLQGALRKLRN